MVSVHVCNLRASEHRWASKHTAGKGLEGQQLILEGFVCVMLPMLEQTGEDF